MSQVTATQARRKPVQERSRRTVAAILDATAAIVDEHGVTAATTRAIADRAGVAYPSLYRFFSDRDQILDDLLARHTMAVDALSIEGEWTWNIATAMDLLDAEFELHIAYYRSHPSAARLWFAGRRSETVTAFAHRRMRTLADRIYRLLLERELIPADADAQAVLVAIELADRAMELAYRGRDDFDDELLALGRFAVTSFIETLTVG